MLCFVKCCGLILRALSTKLKKMIFSRVHTSTTTKQLTLCSNQSLSPLKSDGLVTLHFKPTLI